MAKMKNPTIETPVNIKNFLSIPCGFILLIKIINNAITNKKSKGRNRMKRGLYIFLLLAPGARFERATLRLTAASSTVELPRINKHILTNLGFYSK